VPESFSVAIVSDPLVQRGGAERVVEAMAEAFPEAPVFALLYSASLGPLSLKPRVRTSWLQAIPGATRRHRMLFPMFPAAIESLDVSKYDVILSSHHTVAKGIVRGANQVHVCYCHTPMRALWERSAAELSTVPAIVRPFISIAFGQLRIWDVVTASRVDKYLANSAETKRRVASHYRRSSTLLHPPIDVARFTPGPASASESPYYLVASRAVPYKRVDIAVEAARLAGRRVIVVGGNHSNIAPGDGVEVRGIVDDSTLLGLMRGARALLFPQYEDFGMTPLEMNACGRPTIAYGAGGALETIVDGVTGILVPDQSAAAFAEGIRRFESLAFDADVLRGHAEKFSRESFISNLREIVHNAWFESGLRNGSGIV
jgi:glycosyltransferase involved in cell wall biosynthesis